MTQSEKANFYTENKDFIHFFLKKYFPNFDKSYEDLYMEASLTFLEVIDKYSPDRGTLTTFLTPYLNHSISTYIAHHIFHSSLYYYRTMA